MSRGWRPTLRGAWTVVACAIALVAPAPAVARPVVEPCMYFAASVTFATDRSAFCVGEVRDRTTNQTTALTFFRTADGGRTWTKATALGLVPPSGAYVVRDVFVSPRFADDRAVFVQLTSGLYVTADLGETFLPADPLAWGRLTPFAAGAAAEPVGDAATHTLVAHALRGDSEGANKSTVLDPTTRARTPAKGSPGLDVEFAVSPTFAADGLAYVVAEHGTGLDHHYRLYGCSVAFECSTPLYRWPARWTYDRIWLAGDHATSRTIYASVRPLDGPATLWVSRNAGKTFSRWTAVERLVRPTGFSGVFGLSVVTGTRQVYLRVSGSNGDKASSPPWDQLFWSRDGGTTWTRVSYGRMARQPGPRGSMPPTSVWSRVIGSMPRGSVTATGNGRVFVVGGTYEGRTRYDSVWCTVDNGRTWRALCAR